MRGILYSHYKLVEEYLNKLQQENLANPFCVDDELILQHKEKLSEIYKNYRGAFEQMSLLIKEFEEHRESVRRLLILQNRKKGQSQKNVLQMLSAPAKSNK
jgi:uncharacterized protein (DUF927 family)